VDKAAKVMEGLELKVIYLDEAKGSELEFAKRALETPTGLIGGAVGTYDGKMYAVLPGRASTKAAAFLSSFLRSAWERLFHRSAVIGFDCPGMQNVRRLGRAFPARHHIRMMSPWGPEQGKA
jgi:hypothetical protein